MTWDEGEHEGCGKDSERAFRQWKERAEHAESVLAEQDIVASRSCPSARETGDTTAILREVIAAYDFCAQDPVDRGWSSLDSAISEARRTLALVGNVGETKT